MEQGTKKVLGGCCLGVTILGIVIAGIVGFISYKTYSIFNRFASKTPVQIPALQPSAAEVEAVDRKLSAIVKALLAGEAKTFNITANDLNILIASKEDLKELRGKVNMKIAKGVLTADASVPLDKTKIPLLKGRFFNGEADLLPKTVNGRPEARITDIRVGGESLPEKFLADIRKKDLVSEAKVNIDPAAKKLLKNIESVQVVEESIEIKTKKGTKFISEKPAPVAVYRPTQPELAQVRQKANEIRQTAAAQAGKTFEVTEHELKVFLGGLKNSRYPDMKADVSVKGDIVTAKGCFPLDELNVPEYRGMYFNGEIKLRLGTEDGRIAAYIDDVLMGETSMKGLLKDKLNRNVLKHYYDRDDTEFARLVNTLKSAEIRDGKVFLKSK